MSDDWYRLTKWNKKNEEAFFARLKRSRGQFHKAQYLRIQASYIETKYPEVALRLLCLIINEYPEPFELAPTYLQKAHCLIALSKPDKAIECFRKVLTQETKYKNCLTDGYLDYPTFVVATERKELFDEIKGILLSRIERLMFHFDYYRYHMVLAIVEWNEGNIPEAKEHANMAIEAASKKHSGFRYHPKIGLVKKQDKKINKLLNKINNA